MATHRHLIKGMRTGVDRPVGRQGLHDHALKGRKRTAPSVFGENHTHKVDNIKTGEPIPIRA